MEQVDLVRVSGSPAVGQAYACRHSTDWVPMLLVGGPWVCDESYGDDQLSRWISDHLYQLCPR